MLDAFKSEQVEFMRGKIASGLGQGQYFISREGYSRQFLQHLGFVPFPGTLNVLLDEPFPAEQPGDQNRGLPGGGTQLWRVQMLPHQAKRHRGRCGPAREEPLSVGIDRDHRARKVAGFGAGRWRSCRGNIIMIKGCSQTKPKKLGCRGPFLAGVLRGPACVQAGPTLGGR